MQGLDDKLEYLVCNPETTMSQLKEHMRLLQEEAVNETNEEAHRLRMVLHDVRSGYAATYTGERPTANHD